MRFAFTDEQEELRAVLRRFLQDRAPIAAARAVLDGAAHDRATWTAMAGELGVQSMAVPEALGGQGWGLVELAIAMEELGRVVHPGPFLASAVLSTRVLVAVGGADPLTDLMAGARTAAVAAADDGGGFSADGVHTTYDRAGGVVTGQKRHVISGDAVDDLLVVARVDPDAGGQDVVLLRVDPAADGVHVQARDGLDPTRTTADVRLEAAPAVLVAEDVAGAVARAVDEATACLAAELVGVAQRLLELTVAHARDRVQFGVPIGSFQAVKHRCADMLVGVEHARTAAYLAACRAVEDDDRALAEAASLALPICGDAAAAAAKDAIQLHGGIGFTWEHDAHLFARRAQAARQLLGGPGWHRDRLWSCTTDAVEALT